MDYVPAKASPSIPANCERCDRVPRRGARADRSTRDFAVPQTRKRVARDRNSELKVDERNLCVDLAEYFERKKQRARTKTDRYA